ncbi:hypothetical protein C8J56DRAFT_1069419 [Mycena floridula]|nr:hypothetical protein C8J56DRAFT_1069419 [Mycena floridula]
MDLETAIILGSPDQDLSSFLFGLGLTKQALSPRPKADSKQMAFIDAGGTSLNSSGQPIPSQEMHLTLGSAWGVSVANGVSLTAAKTRHEANQIGVAREHTHGIFPLPNQRPSTVDMVSNRMPEPNLHLSSLTSPPSVAASNVTVQKEAYLLVTVIVVERSNKAHDSSSHELALFTYSSTNQSEERSAVRCIDPVSSSSIVDAVDSRFSLELLVYSSELQVIFIQPLQSILNHGSVQYQWLPRWNLEAFGGLELEIQCRKLRKREMTQGRQWITSFSHRATLTICGAHRFSSPRLP